MLHAPADGALKYFMPQLMVRYLKILWYFELEVFEICYGLICNFRNFLQFESAFSLTLLSEIIRSLHPLRASQFYYINLLTTAQ